jgi:hypothetical protein
MMEFPKDFFGFKFRLTIAYKKMDKEINTLMGIQWHLHLHKAFLEVVECRKNLIRVRIL